MKLLLAITLLLFWFKEEIKGQSLPDYTTAPNTLVYKTKGDYNNLVPVLLSDDKKEILSYPDPKDLKTGNNYLVPVQLHRHYLLDRKGIGSNVAFLKYTYEEYARLENAPPLRELFANIRDRDPLLELCNCGHIKGHPIDTEQLNKFIDDKKWPVFCKILKKTVSK